MQGVFERIAQDTDVAQRDLMEEWWEIYLENWFGIDCNRYYLADRRLPRCLNGAQKGLVD